MYKPLKDIIISLCILPMSASAQEAEHIMLDNPENITNSIVQEQLDTVFSLQPLSSVEEVVDTLPCEMPARELTTHCSPDHHPRLTVLGVETRLGWEQERNDGALNKGDTGFKGQYINLLLRGEILKNLFFNYRQRLNKPSDKTFWDGTDYLYIIWKTAKNKLHLSAGKQIVMIGGVEYDVAPINLYYCSEFWNQIACYQLGLSAVYELNSKDRIYFQVCNSPFRQWAGNNTYGINLYWNRIDTYWITRGYKNVGWTPYWSINVMQLGNGHWMNYISLGNKFSFNDKVFLSVDYINRASSHQAFFSDISLVGKLDYTPTEQFNIFLKYTYDQNKSGTDADKLVTDGTQLHMVSAGFEMWPIRSSHSRNTLRLFAVAGYNWGTNTNANGVKQDKQLMIQAGVYLHLNVLEGIKNIFEKTKH